MKKTFLLALTLLFSVATTGIISDNSVFASPKKTVRKSNSNSSRYTKYTGKVGKYNVTMFLDSNCNGYYYYGNGSNGKLTLKGVLDPEMSAAAAGFYRLYEYNAQGVQTAIWEVYIGSVAVEPGKRAKYIEGDMTTSNGQTYSVSLW